MKNLFLALLSLLIFSSRLREQNERILSLHGYTRRMKSFNHSVTGGQKVYCLSEQPVQSTTGRHSWKTKQFPRQVTACSKIVKFCTCVQVSKANTWNKTCYLGMSQSEEIFDAIKSSPIFTFKFLKWKWRPEIYFSQQNCHLHLKYRYTVRDRFGWVCFLFHTQLHLCCFILFITTHLWHCPLPVSLLI